MSNIRLSATMYHDSEAAIIASVMGAAAVQDRAKRRLNPLPPQGAPYAFTHREKQLWATYCDHGLTPEQATRAVYRLRHAGRS